MTTDNTRVQQMLTMRTSTKEDGTHPTYEAIGEKFGLTRQRVHKLLEDYPQADFERNPKHPDSECPVCHTKFPYVAGKVYDKPECRKIAHSENLTCTVCGAKFKRRKSWVQETYKKGPICTECWRKRGKIIIRQEEGTTHASE